MLVHKPFSQILPEGLFEHMDLMVQIRAMLTQFVDLADRMQYRGVIATTEEFTDFGKALLGEAFGEVHRNLAWQRDIGWAPLAVHVGDLHLVEVGDRLLDEFDRDLTPIERQQVFQSFFDQFERDRLLAELRKRIRQFTER